AIGSLLMPLNFDALYVFVLGPAGVGPEGARILSATLCFALYLATAWWLRTPALTYAALAALAAAIAAAFDVVDMPRPVGIALGVAIGGVLRIVGHEGRRRGRPGFLVDPLGQVGLLAAGLLALVLLGSTLTSVPGLNPS